MKKPKLSPREEKFAYEYVLHSNATKAAINAGYSEISARNIGCVNLTKPNILEKIKYLRDNLAETAELSAFRVLMEHKKIALANAGNLRIDWKTLKDFDTLTDDEKAGIQEITVKKNKYGWETKIKMFDKQRSLDSICEMLGFYAPSKTELTGSNGKDLFENLTDEQLNAKIIELRELVKEIGVI